MKPKRCLSDLTMRERNFKLTGGSKCSVTACASYFLRIKGRNLLQQLASHFSTIKVMFMCYNFTLRTLGLDLRNPLFKYV